MTKFKLEKHGYPAYESAQKTIGPRFNAFHVASIACIIIALVVFPALLIRQIRNRPRVSAMEVSITPSAIYTLAPTVTETVTPSAVPKETHTPYPTLTHTATPEKVRADKEVVYIQNFVTVEVTRMVERIITATPRPVTPSPTPNLTATQTEHETVLARRYDSILQLGVFLGVCMVALFLLTLYANGLYQWATRLADKRRKNFEKPLKPPAVPINDWRDEIKRHTVLLWRKQINQETGKPYSLREIERQIWPKAESKGGAHFDFIKSVLSEYDPLGEYGPTTSPPPEDYDGAGVA